MDSGKYHTIEKYMLSVMRDSAHNRDHVYRVLYTALDIAETEPDADKDILVAACLLHDIGRSAQLKNPSLNHAVTGAETAYKFLVKSGFGMDFASRVRECIRTHRFRADDPPVSIEAKILFDADKIDAAGALGIARTLVYKGRVDEPLYTMDANGLPSDGSADEQPSFMHEFKFKLEKIYSRFYTARGKEIALSRRETALDFYKDLLSESLFPYAKSQRLIDKINNGGHYAY